MSRREEGEGEEPLKGFFRTGIVQLNNRGEHSLFDVRLKYGKLPNGEKQALAMCNAVPPLPFTSADSLKVTFYFENAGLVSPKRFKLANGEIEGSALIDCDFGDQTEITLRKDMNDWVFGILREGEDPTCNLSATEPKLYLKALAFPVNNRRASELPSNLFG